MYTMLQILWILKTFIPFLITIVLLILLLEQLSYLWKKRSVPGPTFVLPFVGNAFWLIRDTAQFWVRQSSLATLSGISANYLAGKFIIFISDTNLSHAVFSNVRPDAFIFIGSLFTEKLFGEHNLIFKTGQEHKDARRSLASNFTPKALAMYISLQQIIILDHLKRWVHLSSRTSSEPIPLRLLIRELNLETSQTVFVGTYLNSETRQGFNSDYNIFSIGLKSIPIDLPGTAFRKARLAMGRLIEALADCAKQSKYKMSQRSEAPTCLIDFYMQEAADVSDADIASFLFNILLGAQDASTSTITWAVTLLDSHPEILAKVREEVAGIWNPESNELITEEQLSIMKYTRAVAREVVRYRPPGPVIPHLAVADFPLTDWYTIPKGTIVLPSVYEVGFKGFTEAERFDPDRFSEKRQEERVHKKNYLAFGAGSHKCPGQGYALNHLAIFIAMFATLIDFKRYKTDGCDDMVFLPTIFPRDDCKVFLSMRCSEFPNPSLC